MNTIDNNLELPELDLMNINSENLNFDIKEYPEQNVVIVNKKDNLLYQYIDCCIGSSGSHYDIALTIHEILKNNYRYIGNKTWQYLDKEKNVWLNDDKNEKLKTDIKTIVCDQFIFRSLYWDERSKEKDIAINVSLDHQLRSAKLLQCSYKLKDNKFILLILKEAKQLFDYND